MKTFSGKLAIQQRVLPSYRAPLFEEIAARCPNGMQLFVGEPRVDEAIKTANSLKTGQLVRAQNQHLFSGSLYLCRQNGFIEWLENYQPDVLLVEANPRNIKTPKAIKWMHQREKKVSGWGLGAPPIQGVLSKFRLSRRKNLYAKYDAIVSYSQRGAKEYQSLGIPKEKIYVAHNAAISTPSKAPKVKPERLKDRPTILFVGRLQARKRLDLLFKACAAQNIPPRLIVVGDGPEKELAQVQAAQHFPSTEFVGAKHGEELQNYYDLADLFVLPGTGGLAIQQAMANGLPVVVAQGDGTQDDLVRPENGWLLKPNDLASLTTTIATAFADSALLRKMGKESFRITKDEINLDKMVDVFINMLNHIN